MEPDGPAGEWLDSTVPPAPRGSRTTRGQTPTHAAPALTVDDVADAISLHSAHGTYLYASPAFTELFGWPPEDLVGRDAYELFHPQDVPDVQAAHAAAVSGKSRVSVQYRLRCSDGSYRWVETTTRTIADGRIVAATRWMAEQRSLLQALDDQRLVADRLRDLERERQAFLTAIAHRARHPMTALLGFTQLLHQRDIEDPDQRRQIYDRMVANAERLSELIEVTTTADELSRRANALERRTVDLSGLVRDTANEFWDLADPASTVTFDLAEPSVVFGDPARLAVLVRALYHNAIKHTPVGNRVWIRVEETPDGWLLAVEDDGRGVPDMLKSEIFERLSHGERDEDHPDPGLGLGLYLVDQIARAHHGRAWVQDRQGGGSSFRVQLPQTRPGHAPARP